MITARAGSIRSGWKPIFIVLSRTTQSRDMNERLLTDAFDVVQMIFKEFSSVVAFASSLMDYVSCLADVK